MYDQLGRNLDPNSNRYAVKQYFKRLSQNITLKVGYYRGKVNFRKLNSVGKVGINSAQLLGNLET